MNPNHPRNPNYKNRLKTSGYSESQEDPTNQPNWDDIEEKHKRFD